MHFDPSLFLMYALSGTFSGILTSAEPLIGTTVLQVVPGNYTYVVSVAAKIYIIPAEETHICTGSLIKNNFVLTAAHCIEDLTAEEIRVRVGSVDLRKGIWYNASELITYDQWADSENIAKTKDLNSKSKLIKLNDIAIIKLSNKVHGWTAKPVTLSYKKTNDLDDDLAVVVGWGRPSEDSEIASRYLREAKVSILRREACQDILYDLCGRRMAVGEKYICTKGYPVAVLTEGDSGGPVLQNNSLLGIHINGFFEPVCNANVPRNALDRHRFDLHLSIAPYREFITDVIKH